jgi:hypothetical protein
MIQTIWPIFIPYNRLHMALTTAQKLRMKEGMNILTVNAPTECIAQIRSLAARLTVSASIPDYEQIHWFVKNKADMEKSLTNVLGLLKPEIHCWIYYPKGSSKMQTDLTRDKGWEKLLKHNELQWVSLVSFDEIWSAFAMRLKTPEDKKKTASHKSRPIFEYIDAVSKTVKLPEDLEKAMNKNKKARANFERLSFTNRKEYVEWVITAKREETRMERIKETMIRLGKNWKNPRNL